MPEIIKTTSEAIPEQTLSGFDPAGSSDSSAPAGIFFHRRSRYFNQASAKSGQGVHGAETAEAAGLEHNESLPGP
jgi:hypothetical protein